MTNEQMNAIADKASTLATSELSAPGLDEARMKEFVFVNVKTAIALAVSGDQQLIDDYLKS